jgi:hypothetical protein
MAVGARGVELEVGVVHVVPETKAPKMNAEKKFNMTSAERCQECQCVYEQEKPIGKQRNGKGQERC